jgi:hypothetical protein
MDIEAALSVYEDGFGNPITVPDQVSADGVKAFVDGFLSYRVTMPEILPIANTHPDCVIANAYAALLWMFSESHDGPVNARPYAERATAHKDSVNGREALIADIAQYWIEGDVDAALQACETILQDYPRDLATLKLAQYFLFNWGDSEGMLRLAQASEAAASDAAYFHGMLAFGFEQCHQLDQAEQAARRGLAIRDDEAWCHHALAHVYLTRGEIEPGTDFLERVAASWADLNSFMYSHNYWHLGLFYIARGRFSDALNLYDRHIWSREKTYSQDQVGAVSFLARLEFARVDIGERWKDVADHIAARAPEAIEPFLSLQYLYALARTDRPQLDELMQAIKMRSRESEVWRDIALPVADGLKAHAKGDYAACSEALELALPRLEQIGGSHAQRDLFDQFYLNALVKSGQGDKARPLLEKRLETDPADATALRLKSA